MHELADVSMQNTKGIVRGQHNINFGCLASQEIMNAATICKPFSHENDQLLFQAKNFINEEHSVFLLFSQAVNLPASRLVSQTNR